MDVEFNLLTETVEQAGPVSPLCVEPQTPIRDVLQLLKNQRVGSTLVCREGVLVGIFTERDALRLMAGDDDLSGPIERVMVPNPMTVQSGATVAMAIQKMSLGGYRRLPIVDAQQRPVGVVHVSGIVHYLVQHFPKTVYNLPPVPNPAMNEREGP